MTSYTLADAGTGRPHAVLDLEERLFPLEISDVRVPAIRELYRRAKRTEWNPATDIDWSALDLTSYSEEQLFAARQYWSWRAWGEYGAISESPALLLRYVLERREPELTYFWTIRTQEEVRHADVCRRMADGLGGYMKAPITKDLGGTAPTHGVRGMSFDSGTSLEAIIAALVCCAEEIALDVFAVLIRETRDPVAKQILRLIMRDEVRHCAFGWDYMAYRAPHLSEQQLSEIRDKVVWMIEEVELKGYHSLWLSPSPDLQELEATEIVAEAGLGATIEEVEKPALVKSVAKIRDRMRDWPIELPQFQHPRMGTF